MARMVLVVDDEPAVLQVVASMLEELGCKVVTAVNATDALELIAENEQIEILFTDVNMPGVGGYELGDKARRIRADLRVMLLSGRDPMAAAIRWYGSHLRYRILHAPCSTRPVCADLCPSKAPLRPHGLMSLPGSMMS